MATVPTPKDRFTSLDTLAVARELRALGPARIDKVFDAASGGWTLSLRARGEGRRELLLVPGRYAALLAPGAVEHSEELSPLARELRRLLVGAGIRGVADPAGERFLEILVARSDDPEPILVSLEMFGTGNLIVARSGKIVAVAQPRRFAHRQVRIGVEYSRPPVRIDPWRVDRATLEAELARSRTDVASTLAARLSFGGPVAEELIVRAGLEGGELAGARAPAAAERLALAVTELLRDVSEVPTGRLYLRDATILDATPYPSRRWGSDSGVEEQRRPSFSEAAHEYFRTLVAAPPDAAAAAAEGQRKSWERLREQQSEAVSTLTASIRELRTAAEAILANYPDAEAAIARARQSSAETAEFSALVGGVEVRLRADRTPRQSAEALFGEMRRRKTKLDGARTALAETESKLAAPPTAASATRPRAVAGEAPRRKVHWFEKFRWFVSSEGVVVIAGRDASSNDLVVRRNLKDGDVYVHADLHGAASVVVKHPPPGGSGIGDATLREAGQWAVAFSKAWRAGLASASAFWVTPEQVSKSAASGEFVARGAWAIHGTKHVLRDLPMEIAIGTLDYEGETMWTAAPATAVAARGAVRAVLVPGPERERDALEVELASELGLSRTRLQSLLPAGGISRRRP